VKKQRTPKTIGQDQTVNELVKIIDIFTASKGEIRPHFIITGPSGSGKSHTIQMLADMADIGYFEINAASLTTEGTSGNSVTKALVPLQTMGQSLNICFVDEFDKLFISGNTNSMRSHDTKHDVQNEFLRVLESNEATTFGQYGHYVQARADNTLFIFAGAFNGEPDLTLDRLREFGLKTEFLGRIGLTYSLQRLSLDAMRKILEDSRLLRRYLELFPTVKKEEVTGMIMEAVAVQHEKNVLGARLMNTLVHKYFIKGGRLDEQEVKSSSFERTLSFN
jgi:ATP-dependent protease Clp ATPase subunit